MSRRSLGPALLAVGLTLSACLSASAETDVYASGVVRGKYLYNTDDEVDASVADTRVELDIGVGALTLGAVYRAYQLTDPAYNPSGVEAPATEFKHRYMAFDHQDLHMTAGHFSSTFGRGLTLMSYEEVDLEHDTFLDGLLAEYEIRGVVLTALAGTATEDVAGTRYFDHVVRAARVSAPIVDWAEIGASAVERSRTESDEEVDLPDSLAMFEDAVLGGELSVWTGPLTLAVEYAEREGENPVTGREHVEGHAAYASSVLELGWLTLFGEFKDYEDFGRNGGYLVNPPTCVREHLWTLMNRATYQVDLDDERGFLVEGSTSFGDAVFVTAGASEARRHRPTSDASAELAHWEIFSQVDWTPGEGAIGSVAGSWSREYLFTGVEATDKFAEHLTGAASAEVTLPADHVVELTLEMQVTEDPDETTHEDYLASAAYYPGLGLTVIGTFEATTAAQASRGGEADAKDKWFVAEVRKLLADDLEVSLSAGTERGGKKCTGGVCYTEPEFEGVRLRFTKFF